MSDASHLTPQFIEERKKQLLMDRASIIKEVEDLKEDDPFSDPDHVIDNAAVDTDVREQTRHQVLEAEIEVLTRKLEDVELALQKIEKGMYGYCEKTNKAIPAARLMIIPEARYCVEKE